MNSKRLLTTFDAFALLVKFSSRTSLKKRLGKSEAFVFVLDQSVSYKLMICKDLKTELTASVHNLYQKKKDHNT